MNNALNARVHKLPFCPECLAKRLKPCVNPNGTTRAPHRVRQFVVDGLVIVKRSKRWAAFKNNDLLVEKIHRRGTRKPGESV